MARFATERERYLETLTFGTPDRVPFQPGWGPRKSTRAVWERQGLPPGADWYAFLCREIGVPVPVRAPGHGTQPGVDLRMRPWFEEKVLEHRDGHYIVQDWMGNVVEIADAYDATYLRNAADFVTRKWHAFPVANRADFEKLKARYNPDDPGRYPEDFAERVKLLRRRDWVSRLSVSGPFWQLREWCGFEPLCEMLIDDPDFVREMAEFWTDFVGRALRRLFGAGVLDVLALNEDMAYKEKPMISPAMTREFIQPAYFRWVREAKQSGVTLIDMDSDGRIDLLIPLWIEAGINVCDPIEVAAGCDIAEYRRLFGRKMAYTCGVDKRCIAKGGKAIEAELARLAPVVRDGGFIPGCDHATPPDVSWPDFVRYSRLLAELLGWI